MDALPQVGQKYQHKKWGEVHVSAVRKIGRGYSVSHEQVGIPHQNEENQDPYWKNFRVERLRDFQKAAS